MLKKINNKYTLIIFILLLLVVLLFVFNIIFHTPENVGASTKMIRFSDVWFTLENWTTIHEVVENNDGAWQFYEGVKSIILQTSAMLVATILLSIAGATAQSLTKNPLADASTLGMIQGSTFMVIISVSAGLYSFYFNILFGLLGGAIVAIFIAYISATSGIRKKLKIILVGLGLGMLFRTLTFSIQIGEVGVRKIAYAFALGGPENIQELSFFKNEYAWTLLIGFILMFISFIVVMLNSKSMTLLELGGSKAKQMGVNVVRSNVISVIILVITIPVAVLLVGNVAFIGLFSIHASRWLTRTRGYRKTIPISVIFSVVIGMMSLLLTNFFPSVYSGLWMTFLGAPYLIFIGVRGLK